MAEKVSQISNISENATVTEMASNVSAPISQAVGNTSTVVATKIATNLSSTVRQTGSIFAQSDDWHEGACVLFPLYFCSTASKNVDDDAGKSDGKKSQRRIEMAVYNDDDRYELQAL